jgi:DNA-binding NarL/FixJ family response regulator
MFGPVNLSVFPIRVGSGQTGRVTIGVFLVDDHEVVRRGITELLGATDDIVVVGEAANGDEAMRRLPAVQPDVAILDIRLGDGERSGVEVCREVRSAHPDVACLILTSYADDEAFAAAVLAGASGYLLKQIRGSELVDSIRSVASGVSLLPPEVVDSTLARLRTPPEDPLRVLTGQERKVLDLIAEGRTNRQIADELRLAEKTVKNYVSNMLAKLGLHSRTEAATMAVRLEERRHRHPGG